MAQKSDREKVLCVLFFGVWFVVVVCFFGGWVGGSFSLTHRALFWDAGCL